MKNMADKKEVKIYSPKLVHVKIALEGTSSLICNQLTPEAMDTIKQPGKDNSTIVAKVGGHTLTPEKELERSKYTTKQGKPGFPIVAFKKAALAAAKGKGWWGDSNISGKLLSAAFHFEESEDDDSIIEVIGELVPRKDMGRRPKGSTPAYIYRYEFKKGWRVTLPVQFNENLISYDNLIALINTAGYGIGVGAWRPERDGNHGMFKIVGV